MHDIPVTDWRKSVKMGAIACLFIIVDDGSAVQSFLGVFT